MGTARTSGHFQVKWTLKALQQAQDLIAMLTMVTMVVPESSMAACASREPMSGLQRWQMQSPWFLSSASRMRAVFFSGHLANHIGELASVRFSFQIFQGVFL